LAAERPAERRAERRAERVAEREDIIYITHKKIFPITILTEKFNGKILTVKILTVKNYIISK
jgi:hypothetical protein